MLLLGLLVFGIALTTAIPIDGEFKTLIICPKKIRCEIKPNSFEPYI